MKSSCTISTQTLQSVQQQCDGIASIDYFFGKAVIGLASDAAFVAEPFEPEQMMMLLMALSYAQRQGHSCLPLDAVASQIWWQDHDADRAGFEFVDLPVLMRWAESLINKLPVPACIRLENGRLYTERYWQFEQTTQAVLNTLHRPLPLSDEAKQRLKAIWPKLFASEAPVTHFDNRAKDQVDWQQIAVALAVNQGFTVLSGGPGTGKTYTVARLLVALQISAAEPLRIVLAAPTGKAAQRLSESLQNAFTGLADIPECAAVIDSIPIQAKTVHRLLGLREHTIEAKFNQQNKLPLDVLIVDESSMLDLALMTRLLRALPSHCRLILVGDSQQLPSVESGNVLPMLMPPVENRFGAVQQQWFNALGIQYSVDEQISKIGTGSAHQTINPCVVLARSYRFGEYIGQLAESINLAGGQFAWKTLVELSQTPDSGVRLGDYHHLRRSGLEFVSENFYQVCCADNLLEAFTKAQQFRVLAAVKQGDCGTEVLNQKIERKLRERLGIPIGVSRFKGQLLMIARNIHALGLFNGDLGIVWPDASGDLHVFFEGDSRSSFRSFDINRVTATQSVYAMTIHKSQGSEFDHVLLVMPQYGGQNILSRELLYTAVTRCRKNLSVIAEESVFVSAVNNQTQRYSGLRFEGSGSLES